MEKQCGRVLEPTLSLCAFSGSGTPVMYLAGSYFALILRSKIPSSHTCVATDSYLLGYYAISTRSIRVVVRLCDPKNESSKIFRSIGKVYQLTRLKDTENLKFSMLRNLTAGVAIPIVA
jgi:hypothetical protein